MVNDAQEIKIRSEIKAGEFLKTMEKNNGAATRLQDVTASPPTLKEMGIQRIQSHRWQKNKTAFALLFLCGGPTKAL